MCYGLKVTLVKAGRCYYTVSTPSTLVLKHQVPTPTRIRVPSTALIKNARTSAQNSNNSAEGGNEQDREDDYEAYRQARKKGRHIQKLSIAGSGTLTWSFLHHPPCFNSPIFMRMGHLVSLCANLHQCSHVEKAKADGLTDRRSHRGPRMTELAMLSPNMRKMLAEMRKHTGVLIEIKSVRPTAYCERAVDPHLISMEHTRSIVTRPIEL